MPTSKPRSTYPAPQRPSGPSARDQHAKATQETILKAATKVFAAHGFAGGKVEMISAAANSHDRMIYYYFGSKKGLYTAVLEAQYRQFNEAEAALRVSLEQPSRALESIVCFVWNYYQQHPEFIRLLNDENLHKAVHIGKSPNARDCSLPAVELLKQVLERGMRDGVFRRGIEAQDIYIMIAALGYFYLSNRFTLSATLGMDIGKEDAKRHWESFILDSVFRTVQAR